MASSNSNWRNTGRDQSDDGQYNKRGNKNSSRGRRRPYNNDWRPRQQGLYGDGDGNEPMPNSSSRREVNVPTGDPISQNSTSTSESGSSYQATGVPPSPKKSDSSSPEVLSASLNRTIDLTASLNRTIDLTSPSPNTSSSDHENTHVMSDSNGNKPLVESDNNTLKSNGESTHEVERENAASPPFESASENEDDAVVDSAVPIPKDQSHNNTTPENGHASPPSPKPVVNSFVELVDSEEEDDEKEADASVTHASLVVNLTDSNKPAINIKSFTTPSPNESPLSSSRSAPPDLSSSDDQDQAIVVSDTIGFTESTPSPVRVVEPTSTFIDKKDALELSNEEHSGGDGESGPSSARGQPYIAKKKNSVSFAPNTIDINEVILGRPSTTTPPSSIGIGNVRSSVSPSILINGADGGGNISNSLTDWRGDAGSDDDEDEDEDDDSGSTITFNEIVQDAKDEKVTLGTSSKGTGSKGQGDPEAGGGVDDLAADEEVQEINSASELPVTATELVAPNGVKVYVVGTAHFSVKSQQDVIETIQKTQPNVVVLELCQSRRNILTLDEETILREASDLNFEKVRLAIRQSGAVQGMLHLLLLSMSAQITKKLGMAPGGEFRVGLHEASKIPNCMIYLGDRPFGITLSRALAALTLKQKIKLCWQFMTNNEDITKEEIERCKEKDLLEKMLIEMMGEYPSISQVFVHERDLYLAHSLWGAALSAHASVCHGRDHGYALGHNHGAPGTVVGVVGMGHVAGIIKHWGKTTEEQISEITIVPEPSLQSRIIRKTIKITFYMLLGYGTYKFSRKVFNFPSDALISTAVTRVPELVNKPLKMFKK